MALITSLAQEISLVYDTNSTNYSLAICFLYQTVWRGTLGFFGFALEPLVLSGVATENTNSIIYGVFICITSYLFYASKQ